MISPKKFWILFAANSIIMINLVFIVTTNPSFAAFCLACLGGVGLVTLNFLTDLNYRKRDGVHVE